MDNQPPNLFPYPDPDRIARQDAEQLNQLAFGYYALGALTLAGALFALVYVVLGAIVAHAFMNASATFTPTGTPYASRSFPPDLSGFFAVFGLIMVVFGGGLAVLTLYAGRCLQTRRHYTLIMVTAILNCFHVPLGTVLGVLTLVILNRLSVQDLFAPPAPRYGPGSGPNGAF